MAIERLRPSVPAKAKVTHSTPEVTVWRVADVQLEGEVEDQDDQQGEDQHGR